MKLFYVISCRILQNFQESKTHFVPCVQGSVTNSLLHLYVILIQDLPRPLQSKGTCIIEDMHANLQNLDRQLQELQRRHGEEMQNLTNRHTADMQTIHSNLNRLSRDVASLGQRVTSLQNKHNQDVRALQSKHSGDVNTIQRKHEDDSKRLEAKHDQDIRNLSKSLVD